MIIDSSTESEVVIFLSALFFTLFLLPALQSIITNSQIRSILQPGEK